MFFDKFLAGKDIKKLRLEICNMCDLYTGTRCKSCGCFMDIKASIKSAKCPEQRWAAKITELMLNGEMDDQFNPVKCCGA